MGKYVSFETFRERVTPTKLMNLANVQEAELESLAETILSRAEAVDESFASVRYAVPLPADGLVAEWTLRIAEYELYKRGPGTNVPEKIRDSYKDTMERLSDLSAGRLQLATDPPLSSDHGKSIDIPRHETYFDADSMRSY